MGYLLSILAVIGSWSIVQRIMRCVRSQFARRWTRVVPQNQPAYIHGSAPPQGAAAKPIYYRTESGANVFAFHVARVRGELRFYILQTMNYQAFRRNSSGHATHRLTDSEGRTFICLADSPPSNWGGILEILKAWSEGTEAYCLRGVTF